MLSWRRARRILLFVVLGAITAVSFGSPAFGVESGAGANHQAQNAGPAHAAKRTCPRNTHKVLVKRRKTAKGAASHQRKWRCVATAAAKLPSKFPFPVSPGPPTPPKPIPTPTPTPTPPPEETPPPPPPVEKCQFVASTSGSDSHSGTPSSPFRSLHKLLISLKAGETGCLTSGQTFDSEANLAINAGETHGTATHPVTITSTDPTNPATITHSLTFEAGVNYVAFSGLSFSWTLPKPWMCWSSSGDPIPGEIITGPRTCASGTPAKENAVQIVIDGKSDKLVEDNITNSDTNICLIAGSHAEGTLLEHDRIHNCGPAVESAKTGFPLLNEEPGWHDHGVYDFGHNTVVRNNYIYDNSRAGVLLYGGGEGAVIEHNILDHNGTGVWIGNDSNSVIAWNIVTNSTSPRAELDYGIGAFEPGPGNLAKDNCLYGNLSGEVGTGHFATSENKANANPVYANAGRNEYTLGTESKCLGYGPDTAQP